jgi:hypothetical protein
MLATLTVGRKINFEISPSEDPYRCVLEYLHSNSVSRQKRRKGNPMLEAITRPPCSWGRWIRESDPLCWGSLTSDSKTWSWVLRWQGPETIVRIKYRPILSTERVSNIKKPAVISTGKKLCSSAEDIVGIRYQTTTCEHIASWGDIRCVVVRSRMRELVRTP